MEIMIQGGIIMTAKLILIEGGDGSGKSTLVHNLAEALKKEGQDVIVTREPGGSPKAEEIRRLILQRETGDNFSPDAEMLLFYAARLQHLSDIIVPALIHGEMVICDRFEVSTFAYQIHARSGNEPLFAKLHQEVVRLLKPLNVHCVYAHCDIDPEIAAERVASAGRLLPDVFDAREHAFHEKVREGYKVASLHLDTMFEHVVLDASKTPEEVLAEARNKLNL